MNKKKKKTKTKAASIAIQQNNTPRLQLMQISAALVILAASQQSLNWKIAVQFMLQLNPYITKSTENGQTFIKSGTRKWKIRDHLRKTTNLFVEKKLFTLPCLFCH